MAVVVGGKNFLKNLDRAIKDIRGRTAEGMLAAGILIEAESKERTPVDEGNLKASHYYAKGGSFIAPIVQIGAGVGYTANYAVYVHEDLNARHTVGQAKFLESAVYDNREKILEVIANRARI